MEQTKSFPVYAVVVVVLLGLVLVSTISLGVGIAGSLLNPAAPSAQTAPAAAPQAGAG